MFAADIITSSCRYLQPPRTHHCTLLFFFKKTSHLFSIHNSKRKKLVGWMQMLPKFIVPNAKKYHWTFNQRAKRKEAKKNI